MLGLLLLLMLLGFAFFSFATQEQASAEYYADAAKLYDVEIDSDALFDWALDQLIIGPLESNQQSVLWPGRHSLVPNMLGMFSYNAQNVPIPFDQQPFNGVGVNLISGPQGQPVVDTNYDGDNATNDNPEYLWINYSPAAHPAAFGTFLTRNQLFSLRPALDAGYTYPDINNVFLAHVEVVNGTRVVIPSMHRPQYLRGTNGVPLGNWAIDTTFTATDTRRQVLFAHPGHMNVADGVTPRYLLAPQVVGTRTIQPFVFLHDLDGGGIFSEAGVWTNSVATNLDYPTDNDGDNIREGGWVDLNFPPQTLPDGRLYVPLFSYTVLDADGLVNVNRHGNLSGFASLAKPFVGAPDPASGGQILPISRSNLGVSATEVNPWWALFADPQDPTFLNPPVGATATSALQQYRGFFGLDDTTPSGPTGFVFDRAEMANADLLFMLWGRPKYSVAGSGPETFTINDLISGRFGERTILLSGSQAALSGGPTSVGVASFPRPGLSGSDDDNDQQAGINDIGYEPLLTGLPTISAWGTAIPPYGLPFDHFGSGMNLQTVTYAGSPIRAVRLQADPLNALSTVRYPIFYGYSNGSQYQSALGGQFSVSPTGVTIDEGDEMVVDRRYTQTYGTNDQVFLPDEMAGLHLSQADYTATLSSSRLRQLMPFNFDLNLRAQEIRKRFTTDSWDRREHGFAYCNYPQANPRGNYEFGGDWDGNGVRNEFPPSITTAALTAGTQPFRTEVASVIGSKVTLAGVPDPQMPGFPYPQYYKQYRLNLNKLLTLQNFTLPVSQSNVPVYRQLTPHPEHSATTPFLATPVPGSLGGATAPTTFTPQTSLLEQEYWARVDRQKMARDIYVMLYMLGGGNDAVDYTTANTVLGPDAVNDPSGTLGLQLRQLYSDVQLREMAQFAVNMVDSLDRDDVLSRFEYDRDLSNGWGLDDNPYTYPGANEGGSIVASERGEVWGVESQALTISEVLAIRQPVPPGPPSDNSRTPWNDTLGNGRNFTFAELRNVSPWPVDLSTGAWRVRLVRPVVGPGTHRSVVPLYNGALNSAIIPANGVFTIGSMGRDDLQLDTFLDGTGSTVSRPADFRIDVAGDAQFELIAPAPQVPEASPPTAIEDRPPASSLDLVDDRDFLPGNRFRLIDHGAALPTAPPVGGNQSTNTDVTSNANERGGWYRFGTPLEDLYFILERRAHPHRAEPLISNSNEENDNPWVEVDRFVTFNGGALPARTQTFPLAQTDGQVEVTTHLTNIVSSERVNALDRTFLPNNLAALTNNTLGQQRNSVETSPSPLVWQPHFDRDFASVMDIMSLPLYGPEWLTARLAFNGKLAIDGQNWENGTGAYEARIARAKFLRPSHPTTATLDNRWYRLLELLEFPNGSHRAIETASPTVNQLLKRVPAKINLNGLRHPEVLFALLDDPAVFNMSTLQEQNVVDSGPARDWWLELLAARDGFDPQSGMMLPGSPGSRPFRDLSFAAGMAAGVGAQGVPALERTLLRRLQLDNSDLNNNGAPDPGEESPPTTTVPYNPPASSPRQLLEARPNTDLANNEIDYHTRNRFLAKVANNSTSRGNVFIVWISVGFFDSYQPDPVNTPNIVQIGAEMPDQPRRRGFFIVDRTLLEEAYDSATGTFDFRKFVQYRKTIE